MILYEKNPWRRWGLIGFIVVLIVCLLMMKLGKVDFILSDNLLMNCLMLLSASGAGGVLAATVRGVPHYCRYQAATRQQLLASRISLEVNQPAETVSVTLPITTLDVYQHIYSPEHHAFCANQLIAEFNKQYLILNRQQLDEFIRCAMELKRDYLAIHPEHTSVYLSQLTKAGYLHTSEPVKLIEDRLSSLTLPPIKNTVLSPVTTPFMSPTSMRRFQQTEDFVEESTLSLLPPIK